MARICIAVVLLAATSASATTFAVEIEPKGWQADALASVLTADLADKDFKASKPATITIHGELVSGTLRYLITSQRAPVVGAIELAGVDRHELANYLRDRVHAITQVQAVAAGPPAQLAEPRGVAAIAGLVLIAALLVAPLAFAGRRLLQLHSAQRIVVAVVALAVAGALLDRLSPALVFVGGGLAWGAFAAVVLVVLLPPLVGLQRVEHGELVPVLTTWAAAALQRIIVRGALLVGVGFLIDSYGDAIGVTRVVALGVLAPGIGLVGYLAWLALVESLAGRLDDALVEGDPMAHPWHGHVRAYFVGYMRRANLDVDEPQLERVRFLPGRDDEVYIYGGGFARTRVVMPRAMLEHALAPYGRPHDYLQPRVSTWHWTHWNAGLVMPAAADAKAASRADREIHSNVDEGDGERVVLGEPATLAGIIEPVALDPRTSYRVSDDPLWLDWDPGEEYDGTDAGDKDYLFGLVVHALGMRLRHEDRAATIEIAWQRWLGARTRWLAKLTSPARAFVARQASALADAHTALGGARHHFAQYLAWRAWHRDELVTARAYVPELEQTSRAITAALDEDAEPVLSRRIAGLRVTRGSQTRSHRRRVALAFAILAGLAGIAALVVQAALYHSTYLERMTAQKQERSSDGKRP